MQVPEWMTNAPTPFTSVLVANRGEIAIRILKAIRECGLVGIGIHNDLDSNSMHLDYADKIVHIPGEDLASTYLSSQAIIHAARSMGADAIHPGYGFLSERADFAEEVIESGLIWIGPPPDAIRVMGDKISARESMIQASVPVIPGKSIDVKEGEDPLPQLAAAAAQVGYPLLLKASAGGGGKGMRAVKEPKLLRMEYEAASREATAAFGDGTVYVETLLSGARHIEIQIFADSHGNIIHLNERDCSLQRRHQKVIEEAPSPAMNTDLRKRMGNAAIDAARAVNYEGAGTVEFLLSSNNDFFFLEMNTRLQVEHPVTELITGLDLVHMQLRVASGQELQIGQDEVGITGHSIEARLYAEDPSVGFLPSIGMIAKFQTPQGPGIRIDSGIREGDHVTTSFDPMLAKLIVHAPDRLSAIRRLDHVLSKTVLHGVKSNIDFCREILSTDVFREKGVTTNYLDDGYHSHQTNKPTDATLVIVASAADKFGLQRVQSASNSKTTMSHSGHVQDPFLTLSKKFP